LTELATPPAHTTAEQALRKHGLTGDRLLRLARRIATDAQHRAPAGLGGKYEDLVSFLALQALEAAIRYEAPTEPTRYAFTSYLCDIMELRITDWYRRKSEGFGDSRSGSNGRVVFATDHLEDGPYEHPELAESTVEADHHYAGAAAALSTPMYDWPLISEAVALSWVRAAALTGQPFQLWIRRTLDIAATHQHRSAA
jgi:DNA-directed RNA polymerase specialized sigma24 family protein